MDREIETELRILNPACELVEPILTPRRTTLMNIGFISAFKMFLESLVKCRNAKKFLLLLRSQLQKVGKEHFQK